MTLKFIIFADVFKARVIATLPIKKMLAGCALSTPWQQLRRRTTTAMKAAQVRQIEVA